MLLGIQFIGILFILLMLYLTFLHYKRNTFSKRGFFFWVAAWIVALLLLLFNQSVSFVAQELQFQRATDLYVAAAIMFFGIITFLNYTSVKRQERKLEDLVRKIALRGRR